MLGMHNSQAIRALAGWRAKMQDWTLGAVPNSRFISE
jgi:hypothetical protein